jgi:hypothetical protein
LNESVLVLSGLDPCGGAGISADIETINQLGLTPLPIVTTMTVQNTQSIAEVQVVDIGLISPDKACNSAIFGVMIFTQGNKSCLSVSIACVCNKVSSLLALIIGSSTMILSR